MRGRLMYLIRAGLLELGEGEQQFERAAREADIAFADLVRRPTPKATDLSAAGKAHARSNLEEHQGEGTLGLLYFAS